MSSVFMKKVWDFNKKEFGSLEFTGLEIPRDYLFIKGSIELNDTERIQDFADKRLQYGVSQTKLAVMAGISREHLSRIESGKVVATEEMKVKLSEALEKFNPDAPLQT